MIISKVNIPSALMLFLTICHVKCCFKSREFQTIEEEKEDIEKLEVEVEHLETKIDGLKLSNVVSSDSAASTDALIMMDKKNCTSEIIKNRQIACGDLDKISSCTCKTGKQYSKEDKFTEDCRVDFCSCLDNSEVKMFGLHRKFLNCITI